jgi:hypothetical protein
MYSRCVPESSSSQVWPPNQGYIPVLVPPIPLHASAEKPCYLNVFHQTSWPRFVSCPRMMDIATPLRMLEACASPIFNSEHKSSGVVVRTCSGVSNRLWSVEINNRKFWSRWSAILLRVRTVDMLSKQSNLRSPRVTVCAPASDVDALDHQSQLACDET